MFARGFGRYFEKKPIGLNTLEVLKASEEFHTLKQCISTAISEDFENAGHYGSVSTAFLSNVQQGPFKGFEEYRKIQEFGENWNVEDFAKTANLGVRDIRRNIHKQKEWRNDIDRMKLCQVPNSIQCFLPTQGLGRWVSVC